jgi:hypothetical protein
MKMYAVRNSEGKWYRKAGVWSTNFWTDDLENARLYTREGSAKAIVTNLYKSFKGKDSFEIVDFDLVESGFINMDQYLIDKERVKKNRDRKWAIRKAEKDYEDARGKLEILAAKYREE